MTSKGLLDIEILLTYDLLRDSSTCALDANGALSNDLYPRPRSWLVPWQMLIR